MRVCLSASFLSQLVPQEPEDMWHLYHLLAPGDNVTAVTFRKVQKENETGLASTNKVKVERCALAYGKRIRSLRG